VCYLLGTGGKDGWTVQEFVLRGEHWAISRSDVKLGTREPKIFAPANLRAAAENEAYRNQVAAWMAAKYTLRYTGALVPDVHHIVTKVIAFNKCDELSPKAYFVGLVCGLGGNRWSAWMCADAVCFRRAAAFSPIQYRAPHLQS
jgi:Fructose-1-6-bisphosphatase, C-terminal domain